MSEPQAKFAEIEALLGALVDGDMRPEQRARLAELLRGDAPAQAFYRDYMGMHVALEFRFGSPAAPMPAESVEAGEESKSGSRYPFSDAMILPTIHEEPESLADEPIERVFTLPPPTRGKSARFGNQARQRLMGWHISGWATTAAAVLVLALTLWMAVPPHHKPRHSPVGPPPPPPVVAQLTAQVDVKGGGMLAVGGALRTGQHVALSDGYAEFTFTSGAKAIVQAPADFTFGDRAALTLLSGRLAVKAAGGFVVHTPSATVTDLGTEFGVAIGPDQATHVDVFKGIVKASLAGIAGAEGGAKTLSAGQAAEVAGNAVRVDPEGAQPQQFVRTLGGIIVRGALVADLRPDLAPDSVGWVNHATGDASVGDFMPAGHGKMAVETVEGPVGRRIAVLRLGQSGGAVQSLKNVPLELTHGGDVSVEAWIKAVAPLGSFSTVAAWGGKVGSAGEGGRMIGTERDFLFGNVTPFMGYYADVPDWGGYQPTPAIWHYVVWVYSQAPKTMTIYVDGQEVKMAKLNLNTSTSALMLGAAPSIFSSSLMTPPFSGYLGAFRVETGTLSVEDIRHNFQRGIIADDLITMAVP